MDKWQTWYYPSNNYVSYVYPYQQNVDLQPLDIGGLWLTDDKGDLQFIYYDDQGNFSITPTNHVKGYFRLPSMEQGEIGEISGILSPRNLLIGTWKRSTINSVRSGRIYLEFYDNGTKFMGKWGYGSEDPQHLWTGHRPSLSGPRSEREGS
ncbi:hypothetical protein EEL31_07095 [Brevibacillus laterosporus]|nr:hypothetical protein [Brevibacillus laterosporus]TPG68316.1 hypothetical protein EEL31_07095 [Brevibacillus laterosporus]